MEKYFAVTAPGLEPLAAAELRQLGLLAADRAGEENGQEESGLAGEESGGVPFEGQRRDLYRANLHLRTASRVLVRLGEFYAAAFSELRKKASRLPWERFLSPGQPVALRVTSHKSKLYHTGGIAERVVGGIADHFSKQPAQVKPGAAPAGRPGEDLPAQMVVVRLVRDLCTISIDSSGELLHRRGYRQETAKAPLRETLAAAMLLASGWDGTAPLLDPFCGSGTIAIEAALLAAGIPPGCRRRYAFMDWPGFDAARWQASLAECAPAAGSLPPIQASDRDAGAIRIAIANAERAGVAERIEFRQCAVSAIAPPVGPGWVVTNPPYGIRVSANQDLRDLYAQFGNVLRAQCPGWNVAILGNDLKLFGQTGLHLAPAFSTLNGGVRVRLMRGKVE